jgi:hypothetical protein
MYKRLIAVNPSNTEVIIINSAFISITVPKKYSFVKNAASIK